MGVSVEKTGISNRFRQLGRKVTARLEGAREIRRTVKLLNNGQVPFSYKAEKICVLLPYRAAEVLAARKISPGLALRILNQIENHHFVCLLMRDMKELNPRRHAQLKPGVIALAALSIS